MGLQLAASVACEDPGGNVRFCPEIDVGSSAGIDDIDGDCIGSVVPVCVIALLVIPRSFFFTPRSC